MQPNPSHRGDPLFLPQLLQQFGVKVEQYQGWRNRGHGDFGQILGIIAHHTGGNNTPSNFIAHHPTLGLCAQIHLRRDGVAVLTGAGVAWHAGAGSYPGLPTNNANMCTIGIEANSDGVSPWPQVQLDAYYRICAAICWYLGLPAARVIGHKEWAGRAQGKWDPGGIDMNDFRRRVQVLIDKKNRNVSLVEGDSEVDFDKITSRYPSRVPGANPETTMTPLDALMNTDAHAFQILGRVEKLEADINDVRGLLHEVLGKLGGVK